MIEPRAMGMFAMAQDGRTPPVVWFGPYPKDGENLYTLADVLAALREPSEAMLKAGSHQGSQRYYSDAEVKNIFLDMLDAWEKEQEK